MATLVVGAVLRIPISSFPLPGQQKESMEAEQKELSISLSFS